MREFYEEPQILFNRVMESGEIQITSFGLDYIKSEKCLSDIEDGKYPAYLANQLLECRILSVPLISSILE